MKRYVLIFILLGAGSTIKAQEAQLDKTTSGIQIGLLGVGIYNEFRLADKIALRTELGLTTISDAFPYTGYAIIPVFSVEPKLYYNLSKRLSKSRRIDGNSGNFISVKSFYEFGSVVILNSGNLFADEIIAIIPTWGLRRNLGQSFNYELGYGLGYAYNFTSKTQDKGTLAAHGRLRIGYRFKK